jgi:hypothetical protein
MQMTHDLKKVVAIHELPLPFSRHAQLKALKLDI